VSNLSSMCNTIFTATVSLPIIKYYGIEPVDDYSWNNLSLLICSSAGLLSVVEMIRYRFFYYDIVNKKKITYLFQEFNDVKSEFRKLKKRRSSRTKEIKDKITSMMPNSEETQTDEIICNNSSGNIKLEIIGRGIDLNNTTFSNSNEDAMQSDEDLFINPVHSKFRDSKYIV
jgi:hypothetical protein